MLSSSLLQTECTFDTLMTGSGSLLRASPALMSPTSLRPLLLPHLLGLYHPSSSSPQIIDLARPPPVWRSGNVACRSCQSINLLSGTKTARPKQNKSIHNAPGISVMKGAKYSSITSNCNSHPAVRTVDNKYKDRLAISQTDSEHKTVSSLRNVSGLRKFDTNTKQTI